MVFRRRDKPPVLSRLREAVAPRGGWRRAIEYIGYRIRRLPDTPHRIALGLACGVFMSFTPLFGFHVFGAMALAWILRANVLASLLGTLAGNPVTFPVIASVSLSLGRLILGHGLTGRDFNRIVTAFGEALTGLWQSLLSILGFGTPQWHKLALFTQDIFWPYLVGGFLPGLISSIAAYYVSRPLIAAYQSRRRGARTRRRIARTAPQGGKP
jgi:uncharacterized protein (DUF2062 family)